MWPWPSLCKLEICDTFTEKDERNLKPCPRYMGKVCSLLSMSAHESQRHQHDIENTRHLPQKPPWDSSRSFKLLKKRFIYLLFGASCSVDRLFNYSNESNYTDKNWTNTSSVQLVCCGHHLYVLYLCFSQLCFIYYFAGNSDKNENFKVVWIKHGQYLWCLLDVVSGMFDWRYIVNRSIKPWLFSTGAAVEYKWDRKP